ncbi:immunity 22 family protein [Metasolibacillus meyeri]|uniref:Immunity 22 family protein n=1 Tax=Metasolibacillus meyeri TaxID=1071052 RepID=A0AAW9NXR5_9BACL|nr:immunity 22 family protein [Metasolibacillus meyeri]MEC1180071.1 immunity 22 family protein [Metasolibacillus meyeri]
MEQKGWVSIWLGNMEEDSLDEYVAITYDREGVAAPAPFFIDFHLDMHEIDEDFIEREAYKNTSSELLTLLAGCSYEEVLIPKIKESVELHKTYNASILLYNFKYQGEIHSANTFDFIAVTNYE